MSGSHEGGQHSHDSLSHADGQGEQGVQPAVQYAEFDPDTAPQVCFSSAPEAVCAPIEPDVAHQPPDNASAQAAVGEEAQGRKGLWDRLGKRKIMWLIGLAVVVCIILVVGISVPLLGDKISRSKTGSDASASDPDSSTTTDLTPSSSSTVSYPPPAPSPPTNNSQAQVPGCERDKYIPNVDWVGIRDGSDWEFDLKGLGSAAECCAYCYETAGKCNAWLYVPAKGPGPDCTLIVGYGGDDADDECPDGRPDVMFNMEGGKPDNLAGMGPCARFTKML